MISTHILDTSTGTPAVGVSVALQFKSSAAGEWKNLLQGETNADGRFLFNCEKTAGIYQITFGVEEYFKRSGRDSFFMNVPVSFHVEDTNRKYHVPLLLNPFGYSTYRGT